MNLNKYITQNNYSMEDCLNAIMTAQDIETGRDDYDQSLVYSLYQKGALAHIAYAEKRLGSMTIDGKGVTEDYKAGLGYYLMAAEDGDEYSYTMFYGLKEYATDVDFDFPIDTVEKAKGGDVSAMIRMCCAYVLYGNHYERALEWAARGALNRDFVSYILIADTLYGLDNDRYLKNPLNAETFVQPNSWRKIASRYIHNDTIFNEVLIVNSRQRFQEIFEILEFVLQRCDIQDQVDMVMNKFVNIVNETNSYRREYHRNTDIVDPVNTFFANEWIERKVARPQTLSRAYELYKSDSIKTMFKFDDRYYANVLGSSGNVYNLNFAISAGKLTNCFCECPAFSKYEGVCKHLVATFYSVYTDISLPSIYKNTIIPEYSSVTGAKLLEYTDEMFIYRYSPSQCNAYVEKMLSSYDFSPVFPGKGNEETYGNFSKMEFIDENNTSFLAMFYPKYEGIGKIIFHVQAMQDNQIEHKKYEETIRYVRSL